MIWYLMVHQLLNQWAAIQSKVVVGNGNQANLVRRKCGMGKRRLLKPVNHERRRNLAILRKLDFIHFLRPKWLFGQQKVLFITVTPTPQIRTRDNSRMRLVSMTSWKMPVVWNCGTWAHWLYVTRAFWVNWWDATSDSWHRAQCIFAVACNLDGGRYWWMQVGFSPICQIRQNSPAVPRP